MTWLGGGYSDMNGGPLSTVNCAIEVRPVVLGNLPYTSMYVPGQALQICSA
jgi:hypothetical protein